MNSTQTSELTGFSQALTTLVSETAAGVVAVKSAAYRVTSGVRLRDDLVAVASHALRREDRIPLQASDGTKADATILGRDPGIDLAILKAEGLGGSVLPYADAASLKPGALAALVGFTVDVGPTASLGILGAVGGSRRTWRGGTLDQFLRLDVNMYPSQAGAAVVTAEGQLIGMASPALSRHSVVAIPPATIERIARELLEQGRIRHGYLGVGVQPVALPENLRSDLGSRSNTGLILLSVEADSPAEKAGLQLGDILIMFNGHILRDVDELQAALRDKAIDQAVKAILLRGGKPMEVEVTVSERGAKK